MAMNIRRMQLADLNPADYNPRKDLQPDDPTYLKIKQSLETFGMAKCSRSNFCMIRHPSE